MFEWMESVHNDAMVSLRPIAGDLYVCRYEEDTGPVDPHIPTPNSQGEDLEALLHNLKLTEWSAYSHYRSLVADLNSEPPLTTDGSQLKVVETDIIVASFGDELFSSHINMVIFNIDVCQITPLSSFSLLKAGQALRAQNLSQQQCVLFFCSHSLKTHCVFSQLV